MIKIPKFLLYGQDDPNIEEGIQPSLPFRRWSDLSNTEKQIAFQEIKNRQWLTSYSREILQTIDYLNYVFLRQCPGKHLHGVKPQLDDYHGGYCNESDRTNAALLDFQDIFLQEKSDAMVFRMLTKFAQTYIDDFDLNRARDEGDGKKREGYIADAFKQFDVLANCLNHIFEQFSVNVMLTRNGLIPRQDKKIIEEIYTPTLKILADPKWRGVSDDLAKMFEDYRDENYPEAITKAHGAVQRFLQILVGEEGKSGKGEVGKLFGKAKQEGIIPVNRFTEPLVNVLQGFIPAERATNSTAKPALKTATSADALLMMNVVMVFLQHCLQKSK
ncbi:MAG: hypothetical protein Q8P01_00875 [bacterium]|nr:hypothetical protein [bacterium]